MKPLIFFSIFLFVFVFFSLVFSFILNKLNSSNLFKETFSNYYLAEASGSVKNHMLLENSYPLTGNKEISNNDAYNIWWHYPVFQVGSYTQLTNNIKYPNNPDDGTCMPASMCQTLYKNKQENSNHVYALPPVNSKNNEIRVNYYNSNKE
jgi:hypothetical protein